MFGGAVKGGIGGGVTLMAMDVHAAVDMHRDVGAKITAFARDRDMASKGAAKYFSHMGHTVFDMATQRLADVDLLTLNMMFMRDAGQLLGIVRFSPRRRRPRHMPLTGPRLRGRRGN